MEPMPRSYEPKIEPTDQEIRYRMDELIFFKGVKEGKKGLDQLAKRDLVTSMKFRIPKKKKSAVEDEVLRFMRHFYRHQIRRNRATWIQTRSGATYDKRYKKAKEELEKRRDIMHRFPRREFQF